MAFSQRVGSYAGASGSSPAGPYPNSVGALSAVRGFDEEVGAPWKSSAVSMFEAHRKSQVEEERRREYEREKARQATIARSKQEAARRAMGSMGSTGGDGGGAFGQSAGAFAWKSPGSGAGGLAPRAVPSYRAAASAPSSKRPFEGTCQEAVEAMMSRTVGGMKEGLAYLNLPTFPIDFAPGSHLKLCGHSVREEVNAMIHSWLTDDREAFFDYLDQVRNIVDKPLLTEEQVELVGEGRERWVKVRTQEGEVLFARRNATPPGAAVMEDDDDDEVLDVPSPPTAQDDAKAPGAAPPPPQPVRSSQEQEDSRRDAVPAATSAAATGQRSVPAPAAATSAASPATPVASGGEAAAAAAGEEDYYSLLGVEPSEVLAKIRDKFRELVLIHHPQKGGDEAYFQRLRKAYQVLSNVQERQRYDLSRAKK